MSLVIPPGFAQASIVLTGPLGTAPYVTTLGLDISDRTGSLVDVADMVMGGYATQFASTTNGKLTISHVTLLVGQDGGNGSVQSSLSPIECENNGSMAPIAMAPIVRKVSADLGRSGRGRMFLPGALGEVDVDDNGQLDATFRENVTDAANQLLGWLITGEVPGYPVAGPCPPVILHNEGGDALPTTILSFSCAPTVGWIRKRLR